MALSNDIVKAFAKLTNIKTEDTGASMKGTFQVINGKEYVRLDGSDVLTPVSTNVEAVADERVVVLIKDHIATVTENITSPAARNKSVQDLKDEVDEFGNTINQMDNTIIQQGNSIIQIENSINQQGNTINQHNTLINQQGDEIVSINNTIIQQGNAIDLTNNAIVAQGNNINSINNTITEHGNNINSINNTITEHGNSITSINNTVTQHGNQISQFGDTITSQGNTIVQQGNNINSINNTITEHGNNINSINNTITEHGNSINSINNVVDIQGSDITILNSGFSIVNGVLTGLSGAIIDDLKTNSLNATYANIDFSNIQIAAIETLFTESGIIKDLVVQEGHITGELIGVTLKGDLIEGNTIKADKLVVLGEDGIYYKLNVSAETVELEQTNENSLNGSIITAKSITASKIVVDDLVAFGATIAGFIINSNSIHSETKGSISSDARGLYFDKEGQFYLGDATNHVKFYKDINDEYVLDIRTNKMFLGASTETIGEQLLTIEENVENIELQRPFYRYSANADGSSMTATPQVSTRYLGTYVGTAASATYTDYTWTLIKGDDGERGSVIWTTTVAPATPDYTFTISNLVGGDIPRVGDIILYSYYKYTVVTVGATTLLAGTRVSIRGATGATGTGAKWYTGTAITGTSTTATIFSGSGITGAIVGDMYLNTSTNNTYRCTLAGNAATAKWVFEVNIKGLDGDDGKSLWLAYCDEIDTYTGFSVNPADSNKDYYGMYVGLTQSNTATDYEWYPSNYKIESEIVSLTTTLTQTAEGLQITTEQVTENTNIISSTQTELLNINENLSVASDNATLALEGVGTLEDTTSGLLSTTNDLTTRLEYQETTVSDLVIDIDGVKQSMTYSGGYNLIENCVKQFGEAGWTGTFVNYSNTEIQQNSLTKSALVFMEDTDTREIQTENRVHNFSFKYKKLVPLATATITINGIEIELTEDEWTEVEQNILVESNLVTMEYSSDADNSVWLVDPLLIPGNIQQIWTPNPNEINTGVIKLGGDTLTIESTSSSTVFKASTDGTRVYNVNDLDNPIAEFTSEGVETNKITGTKGEISKVLILDLGTQTWFTRT